MFSNREKENIDEILVYLENAEEGFVSIEVNHLVKRDQIIEEVKDKLKSKKTTIIDLSQREEETPFNYIEKNSKEAEVVFIINYNNEKEDKWLIKNLNLRRDSYDELEKILVFFFPTYFIDELLVKAPDFWSFVFMKYKFLEPSELLSESNLEEDRKGIQTLERRVKYLEKVLLEYNLSKKERSDILLKLGKVYSDLSKYKKALECYDIILKEKTKNREFTSERDLKINLNRLKKKMGEEEFEKISKDILDDTKLDFLK